MTEKVSYANLSLYSMLAGKLRGFEYCDAQKIYRHFVRGKANIDIESGNITVTLPRKVHNPILRAVLWQSMPKSLSWMSSASLNLKFK